MKQPWEMTRDEFAATITHRVYSVPSITMRDYAQQKGIETTREDDVAVVIFGSLNHRTKMEKGKQKGSFQRVANEKQLEVDYRADIDSGVIPMKTIKEALRPDDNRADYAYINCQHKRAIVRALSDGQKVPQSILDFYEL